MEEMSGRVVAACALFGVMPGGSGCGDSARERVVARAREAAGRLDRMLRAGEVALVTGPSGGGKSTIVRALARRVRRRGVACVVVGVCGARGEGAVIDRFAGPVEEALRVLARAGLADATILSRRAGELSEGQRFRLGVALGMARLGGVGTLIIDEFASVLDRTTAACVARGVRRWVWGQAGVGGVRVVCATAHDDLLEALAPDVVVHQPLEGEADLWRREDEEAA